MFTFMFLALSITTQDSSARHVRSTDPKILRLIDAGLSRSATFRGLIAMLNESDVIVYVEPNLTRQTLDGYLAHHVHAQGQYRYLRIAVRIAGSERHLVSTIAHELQHAVEVAHSPDVRDPESLKRLFSRLAFKFGCSGPACFETKAAQDVEGIVDEEFAASLRSSLRRSITGRM
jgi:hypothetical protein